MALPEITVSLSDGQKLAALKRYAQRYQEELTEIESTITDIKTSLAELEFLKAYLGEQPEVNELGAREEELERLEKRRNHLGMLIERFGQVIPGADPTKPSSFQRF